MSVRRVRWHGYGLSATNGDYGSSAGNYMYGGDGGYQDTPPDWVETFSGLQSRAWMQSSYWSEREFGSSIGMTHFAGPPVVTPGSNNCWAGWSLGTAASNWSFRVYIQWTGSLIQRFLTGIENIELISGWSGGKTGTKKWGWGVTSENLVPPLEHGGQGILTAPSSTTVRTGLVSTAGGYQFGGKSYLGFPTNKFTSTPIQRYARHRIEGRCASGVLTINIYQDDLTANGGTDTTRTDQLSSKSINLTLGGTMDYFVLGAKSDLGSLRPNNLTFSAIEFWDDTSSPDAWPRGQYVRQQLSIERVTAPGVSTPFAAVDRKHPTTGVVSALNLSSVDYYGEVKVANYNTAYPEATYKNIPYTANANPSFDIYIPDESVFPGPHPMVTWVHGGFFSAGGKATIDKGWVASLTSNGYAVIAPSYPLVLIQFADGGPNSHPIQIRYIKKFLKFISDPSFTDTWSLDATKLVVSGHSAGGFLSQAAAHSANLGTINGYDLNGSASFAGMGLDVEVAGAYTYSAPVYWERVISENAALSVGKTTTRSYMGLGISSATVDNSYQADLIDFITAGSPQIPTAYVYGTSDSLVTPQHGIVNLQPVLASFGTACDLYAVNAAHDNIMDLNNPVEDTASVKGIVTWMNTLHGGPPSSP